MKNQMITNYYKFEILKQFLGRFIVILCSERLSKNIVIEFGDDYHVTWIMLIKSTLLEETAVIKSAGEKPYKANLNIPKWIYDIIEPVFNELSSNNLLLKCLYARLQISNESLHSIAWIKCPKNVFVEKQTLKTGL